MERLKKKNFSRERKTTEFSIEPNWNSREERRVIEMRNKKKKEENLNKVGSKLNIAKERLSDLEDRSKDSPGVQYRKLIRYKWLRW